jgi:hypothetical protein
MAMLYCLRSSFGPQKIIESSTCNIKHNNENINLKMPGAFCGKLRQLAQSGNQDKTFTCPSSVQLHLWFWCMWTSRWVMNVLCMCPSSELLSVNCNNTGTLTADKHAHTCLKPRWRFSRGSASKKLTFRGLGKSFEEREIQSKVCFWAKIGKKKLFFSSTLKIQTWFPG